MNNRAFELSSKMFLLKIFRNCGYMLNDALDIGKKNKKVIKI